MIAGRAGPGWAEFENPIISRIGLGLKFCKSHALGRDGFEFLKNATAAPGRVWQFEVVTGWAELARDMKISRDGQGRGPCSKNLACWTGCLTGFSRASPT